MPVLSATPTAMGSLLSDLSTVMTAIFGQITKIATTIVITPFWLFCVGFLFRGGCFGIFGGLIPRNCLWPRGACFRSPRRPVFLEVSMTSFVSSLFGLALFPFRSLSVFVVFPVCCSAVVLLFAFIFRLCSGSLFRRKLN